MFEDDYFWGMLTGAAIAAAVLVWSLPNYPKDCDTLGAFRTNGVVYECHRKPAAQGVVK